MLYFVNSGLFSLEKEVSSNQYGDFNKLSINTSTEVIKNDANDASKSKPSIRTIAKLVSPLEYNIGFNEDQSAGSDFINPPLSLSYSVNYNSQNNDPRLLFKFQEGKRDNGLFVVAIPFNGILIPLKESPDYRILKGVLSISDNYTVTYNNRKYKKILYLVISPKFYANVEQVKPEDLYIDFDSYSYNKPKENPTDNTSTHETYRLRIANPKLPAADNTEKEFVAWDLLHAVENNVPCTDLSEFMTGPMFKVFKHVENVKQPRNNNISTSVEQAWNRSVNSKKKNK